MKKNKFQIVLYVLILIAVLAMFSGTAIYYYNKVIKPKNVNIEIKTINLLVEYNNSNQISLNNIKYGEQEPFSFTVRNDSKDEIGNYRIEFEIITPLDNMIDENFIYDLECETNSSDTEDKTITIKDGIVPVSNKDIGSATITPGNTHQYTLKLNLVKNNQDKDYLKDKIFVAKIKVLSVNE